MKSCRPSGASLVEVLFVVAISTVVMVGAAAHFRTLRQASDLVQRRRDTFQNARVALERIARDLRCARRVAAISDPGDSAGSITVTDWSDDDHVFAVVGTELRYGIGSATDLLAQNIQSLTLEGYDWLGPVAPIHPGRVQIVKMTLTAAIPDSSDTVNLTTRVGLRRGLGGSRISMSYASQSTVVDLAYPWNAYGAADGLYAYGTKKTDARLHGFTANTYTGPLHRVFAGLQLRIFDGPMSMRVYHGGQPIYDYVFTDADIALLSAQWGWWWLDITETTSGPQTWSHEDIDDLTVEIQGNGIAWVDAAVIRAFFDAPDSVFFWADRQGDGVLMPNDWEHPANALGSPDNFYATADWANKTTQSMRATVSSIDGEILAVHICLEAYVDAPFGYTDDWLEVQAALPSESFSNAPIHPIRGGLGAYVGAMNEGLMFIDISNDRPWSAAELDARQLRIHTEVQGLTDALDLKVDAVGWRVIVAPFNSGIFRWSEE